MRDKAIQKALDNWSGMTFYGLGTFECEKVESRLSEILEDTVQPKYYLSEKACQGILSRANRRGKTLPPELQKALEKQSRSKNEPESLGGQGNPYPTRQNRSIVNP